MTDPGHSEISALEAVLARIGPVAIAVSGGVDSMTLAYVAHRATPGVTAMYHAVSPAVPPEAEARVRDYADRCGWDLKVVSAGEFEDPDYLKNPVNRCFFCKTNLYGTIAGHTDRTIASGTNLDDLGDFRPGLEAARDHRVRHPWVEAGIDKQGIRRIAGALGLTDLAELPAAPCLSSRLETGIVVTAPALDFVHQVEKLLSDGIKPLTVRCRIRRGGPAVELDAESLGRLRSEDGAVLRSEVAALSERHGYGPEIKFERYRMGSAFRRD